MRRTFISLASTAAFLLSALASAQSSPVQVGVVDAALKVRPTDKPSLSSAASLTAARNEFEPFQIVLQAGDSKVTGVSASSSDLKGSAGTIAASNVRLYRLGYLNLTTPSNAEGGTGLWPDPLIPDVDEVVGEKRNAFPFDVPAQENRVVFVDLHVPSGTAPGVYSGTVTVNGSGMSAVEVPITLRVLNFELPATSSMASTFGMTWNGACEAHYGSYEACGGDAGVTRMHVEYARFMLDHRITADAVYTGPQGSSGAWDWAGTFDPYYGPLLDGTSEGALLGAAQQTTFRYVWGKNTENYRDWAEHFRSKGWLERSYDYTCDEPPMTCAWSDIPARAAAVHSGDPELRTLVTTNIDQAKANGVDDDIDIIVPVVNDMDNSWAGNQRSKYDAFLASGPRKALWWYQSCMSHGCGDDGTDSTPDWPSYMVDASGVQNRAMQWLAYTYGVTGEVYYETLLELPNAWNSVYAFGGNGDGTLLYPGRPDVIGGTTHIPVASYRLKMIREGMEDYEYLKRLGELGQGDFARSVIQSVFPNPWSTRQPVEKLREARHLLEARIAELTGGGSPPPLEGGVGRPPPTSGVENPSTSPGPTKALGCSATGDLGAVAPLLLLALALLLRLDRTARA